MSPTLPVLPAETVTSIPPTVTPAQPLTTPIVTATQIQLPVIYETSDDRYCLVQEVQLPTSDAQGLSEDEITKKLMDIFLTHFTAPEAPGYCRIDDYRIEKIYFDERLLSLSYQPKGDFMRVVGYSVKLIQLPSSWMAFPGKIDQQNWLHTGLNAAIFHSTNGYIMKFAYP
jgi:hypothetical protein